MKRAADGCSERRRLRRGFTLLELLLAMALAATVLIGLNTFVFSMGELWGRGGDVRLFDRHVRACSRFLEDELRRAALPPAFTGEGAAVTLREVRGRQGGSEPLLTFLLPGWSRLLTWPERPLPEVVASLAWRPEEGLLLLWHSLYEERFATEAPREAVLSPLVTGLAYAYYDEELERWETADRLRMGPTGELLVPQRLRLTFTYKNIVRDALVTLPRGGAALPAY